MSNNNTADQMTKTGEANESSMIHDLTEGNVTRLLLSFAFPLFVANLLQGLYNLVDMVVVGQVLGGTGMSAVSIGGDLLHLLTFVAMGFSSAGQVIIARYIGEKRFDKVNKLIGTMFTSLLLTSVVIAIICYVGHVAILGWLNTPAESYDFAMSYMVVCIFGLPFIYGYNIVSAILRGMGDSRRPFLFVAIAAVLNTVLDIIFVAFLDMDVFGAALATVIGQGVSFLFAVYYLYQHKENFGFDFRLRSFKVDGPVLRHLIALGIPMAIQSASINLSKIILMRWINFYGVNASALSGIYNKVGMIVGIITSAFTTAGSSMIGQSLGAKRYDRVPKVMLNVLWTSSIVPMIFGLLITVMPATVFRVFTKDQAVLVLSSIIVVPICINFLGNVTRTVAFSLINGSGNAKLNLAVALLDGMVARVLLAFVFTFRMGLEAQGCWLGDSIAGLVPILIGMTFYLSGRWKK